MIYAIQCGKEGPIKFGYARNPKKRLSELQVANPERLILLGDADWHHDNENLIHSFLREHWIRGEWFKFSEPVIHVSYRIAQNEFSELMSDMDIKFSKEKWDRAEYMREYMRKRRAIESNKPVPNMLPPYDNLKYEQQKAAGEVLNAKFDRTAYQREYMRTKRAKTSSAT